MVALLSLECLECGWEWRVVFGWVLSVEEVCGAAASLVHQLLFGGVGDEILGGLHGFERIGDVGVRKDGGLASSGSSPKG